MKKIINNPADVVPEMVNGMVRLYPQYIEKIDGTEVMVRSDKESMQGKVGIVSGGGSGHEPSHAGFVGKGMLVQQLQGKYLPLQHLIKYTKQSRLLIVAKVYF